MALLRAMIKTYQGNKMDRAKIKRIQQKRLRKLVLYAAANSPYYQKLFAGAADDFSLEQLPVTDKPTMIANFDDVLTDRNINMSRIEAFTEDLENVGKMIDGRYLIFKTSGSTGNPAVVLYDRQSIDVSSAVAAFRTFTRKEDYHAFMKHGKRTTGVFADYGFYLACGMSRYLRLKMPRKKTKITVDVNAPEKEIIRQLNNFMPSMLSGYPSNLSLLADYDELNIRPDVIFTGGELLTDEIRRKLTDRFGCYVQTHYSCTEGGEIACECTEGHLHLNEDLRAGDCLTLPSSCPITRPVPTRSAANSNISIGISHHRAGSFRNKPMWDVSPANRKGMIFHETKRQGSNRFQHHHPYHRQLLRSADRLI